MVRLGGVLETKILKLQLTESYPSLDCTPKILQVVFWGPCELYYMKKPGRRRLDHVGRIISLEILEEAI